MKIKKENTFVQFYTSSTASSFSCSIRLQLSFSRCRSPSSDVIGRLHILVLARVLRKALPLKNNKTCLIYKQSLDQLTLIFRFCAPYLKYFLKHFKLIIFLLLKSQVVKIRIHVTDSFKSI